MPKILTEEAKQAEEKIKERVKHLFTYLVDVYGQGVVDRALPDLGFSAGQRVAIYEWKNGKRILSPSNRRCLSMALNINVEYLESYLQGTLHYEQLIKEIFKGEIPYKDALSKYFPKSGEPLSDRSIARFFDAKNLNLPSTNRELDRETKEQLSELELAEMVQKAKILVEEIDSLVEQVDRKSFLVKSIIAQLESRLSNSSINSATDSRDFDPTTLEDIIRFTLDIKGIDLQEFAERVNLEKEQIELLLKGFYPEDISLDDLAADLIKAQTHKDVLTFKNWNDLRESCGL